MTQDEAGATDAPRPRAAWWRGRGVVRWSVPAAPVVAAVVAGWQRRWMSDDGFIHLRVVSQLVDGNGPVFNAGERVEASTSPLWVALLALAHPVTTLALPWKAIVLGILLTAVGVLAAVLAAERAAAASGGARLVLPLGALAVVALPPFWDFASSGLETGLVFAWLGGSCWWSARTAAAAGAATAGGGRWDAVAGGVLVGLGPLIRPDLALFAAAFGAVLLAALWRRGRAVRLALVGAAAALPVAYQVFRMGYYAMVVPNTAVAKEAGDADWAQGRRYLADLVDPYWLWVPLALLGLVLVAQVGADLRARAWLRAAARAAPAVAAVVHALYLTRLGGDFMHARLLLPAVFALAAPVGLPVRRRDLVPGWRASWRVAGPVLACGVCAWAVVCAAELRRDVRTRAPWGGTQPVSAHGIADEREFYRTIRHLDPPVRLDESLGAQLRDDARTWPQDRMASVGETNEAVLERLPLSSAIDARAAQAAMSVGASSIAWGNDVYVIDVLSLAHPVGSHLDHTVGDRPGHQKPVPLVWRTAGMVEGRLPVRLAGGGAVVVPRRDLAAADRARACGQLGRYLGGIQGPLTPARFARNILHALPNTTLRVPTDPHAAERRLCAASRPAARTGPPSASTLERPDGHTRH
jgi:arabinofuranosyltransferase